MEKFVLKFKTGEFVAIDILNRSEYLSGHPYRVTDVFQSHFWNSENEALKFISQEYTYPTIFDNIERKVYKVSVSVSS